MRHLGNGHSLEASKEMRRLNTIWDPERGKGLQAKPQAIRPKDGIGLATMYQDCLSVGTNVSHCCKILATGEAELFKSSRGASVWPGRETVAATALSVPGLAVGEGHLQVPE